MDAVELIVRIQDRASRTADGLERTALDFGKELLGIRGVHSIRLVQRAPMKDAKSGSAYLVEQMVVTISASAATLRQLRLFLHEWLRRNDQKSIELKRGDITVNVNGISDEEITRMVRAGLDLSDGS